MNKISEYNKLNSIYRDLNPTWHVEDSPWKANQIISMFRRHSLSPKSIAEVGCGAGEILNQLHNQLNENTYFVGYEIAPDAFELAKTRIKSRLSILNEDIFQNNNYFDLLLVIDIFEHVDDYLSFVKQAKYKAQYKIFHIPLDMNVLNVFRRTPILKAREKVGHLHYFSKDTALATLTDSGHEVIDYFYTPGMLELGNKSLKTRILNPLRSLLFKISPDFSTRLLGGYSLMVLTK